MTGGEDIIYKLLDSGTKTFMKHLVIVESPAKAKTIEKILGSGYKVQASYGHVRDLPKSKLGVNVDHDYEPEYVIPTKSRKNVTKLRDMVKDSDTIYIATDEDREGEAIGWHIAQVLNIDPEKLKRIAFHEITKEAVLHAIENPRDIDLHLVNAQQARRVLDRLVGYKLSPLLWKKLYRRLSAGRVQSVALRLLVEREKEIKAFNTEEYWTVGLEFQTEDKNNFPAEFLLKKDEGDLELKTEEAAQKLAEFIKGASEHIVTEVKQEERSRPASAPFTTSTLQQSASTQLEFTVKKTMMIAQQLYEGVRLGSSGPAGLITYMRTDSTNLAASAVSAVRQYIEKEVGKEYLPDVPMSYRTKNKSAQEAHEAIRPTDPFKTPESVRSALTPDQYRLYKLIWSRFVACQMKPAVVKVQEVIVTSGTTVMSRAEGLNVVFPGYAKIFDKWPFKEVSLPPIKEKEELKLIDVIPTQHFTEPPARYTEASLVKRLEKMGIGRPSTYAPTISTLTTRDYVVKEKRALVPQELGIQVSDFLVEHFPNIVDYNFTARMEKGLDTVAEGKMEWIPLIRDFYEPFIKQIKEKEVQVETQKPADEVTDKICPKCGGQLVIKTGRFGKFLACSNFPTCKHTEPVEGEKGAEEETDRVCSVCGAKMVKKHGRFGPFYGCSNYPECKNIENIETLKADIQCPKCKQGNIVLRKTKRGKVFYGCNRYPECDFATWDEPVDHPCPTCGEFMTKPAKKGYPVCTKCGFEEKDAK